MQRPERSAATAASRSFVLISPAAFMAPARPREGKFSASAGTKGNWRGEERERRERAERERRERAERSAQQDPQRTGRLADCDDMMFNEMLECFGETLHEAREAFERLEDRLDNVRERSEEEEYLNELLEELDDMVRPPPQRAAAPLPRR